MGKLDFFNQDNAGRQDAISLYKTTRGEQNSGVATEVDEKGQSHLQNCALSDATLSL
jgi:hypothetical protein